MHKNGGRRINRRILLISVALTMVALIVGAAAIMSVSTAYTVPILMYHSIDYNDKSSKLSVSPENFAKQMEFLYKNRYNVVSLEKAVSYIKNKERPPRKTVAITFDDGFQNNYQYVYPLLKRYKMPATLFVIVNRIGDPGFVTWDEVKEMSDSGIVTIGSHTRTHFWLLGSDEHFLKNEVEESKKILEEKLGRKVNSFCYPMGAFDAKSKKAVEAAGYMCAVSTNPKNSAPDDIFAIKRVKISRSSNNLLTFWAETTKYYTWFKQHKETE